ncbi:DNA-binding transcriptional activator KdpE [uncultured Gammaproteobacteria bacterium]
MTDRARVLVPRVLVIDDEPQIRRFLRVSLDADGYGVIEAGDGGEGLKACVREKPDLVILDLGLPDRDGIEVIQRIREWSAVPIIVLSIRTGEADKVTALDHGADDFVTKPFGMGELLARMRTALRHRVQVEGAEPVFVSGRLRVDLVYRQVLAAGQPARLSPKEYDLLRLLVRHAGKVLTHRHILREVWGPAHEHDTQYLRVLFRQLRQKIEADATHPRLLITEAGVGYRLQILEQEQPE